MRRNHPILLRCIMLALILSSGKTFTHASARLSTSTQNDIYDMANARWFRSEIDTYLDTGQYVSLAIDAEGTPNISYYDATLKDLQFAYYLHSGEGGNCGDNSDWMCVDVDTGTNVGTYNSIAVLNTYKAISYHDSQNGDLKIARNSGGYASFYRRTIERGTTSTSTGLYTSIALNSEAVPYISYYFNNASGADELKIAYRVNSGGNCGFDLDLGKWRCTTIQTGEGLGQYTSIALDHAENVHIAYYDANDRNLWYATNSTGSSCGPGDSWTCYPVAVNNDVGKYASMYVDAQYNFHIAYYDETNGKLMYAKKLTTGVGNCGVLGSAQCDVIDDMRSQYFPQDKGISIAQDAAGYPMIAYQSQFGDLKVARPIAALGLPTGSGNCGPVTSLFFTWQCTTIHGHTNFPNADPAYHGDYIDLALNSAGLGTIAYYEFIKDGSGNLGVAQQRIENFLPHIARIH